MCPIPPKYWEFVKEMKEAVFNGEDIKSSSDVTVIHKTINPLEYLSDDLPKITKKLLEEEYREGYQGIIVLLPWVCKKTGKDYAFVKDVVKTILDTSIDVTGLCLNHVFDNWKGEPINDERIHLLCLYEK